MNDIDKIVSKKKIERLFYWTIESLEKHSNEAYFNKDKAPLSLCFLEMTKELRSFYDDYVALSDTEARKQSIINKKIDFIKALGLKYEKKLQTILNAEVVNIGFNYFANAACYPLYIDKNLVKKKNKNKYEFDREFEAKLEDVIETSNGFRFRHNKDIKLMIIFGFGLFKQGLTDEEIVGLLLHEFGHSLQQLLVSASLNFYCELKSNIFDQMYPFGFISNFFSSLVAKFTNPEKQAEKDQIKKNLGKDFQEYNRDEMIEDNRKLSENNISIIFKYKKLFLSENNGGIIGSLFSFIANIFKLGYHLIRAPFFILVVGSSRNTAFRMNEAFLKRQIRFEQFADYMAAQYGYGPELASALAKLAIKDKDKEIAHDFGFFNLIYYVPLVNLMMAYYSYHDIKQSYYIYGYPTNQERYEGIYKALQYELNNNKTLSKEDKEAIKEDMEKVKKIHKCSLEKKGAKFFFYKLFCKITRKSIESASSGANIEKNVLEVFNQTEDEYKREVKE